MRISEIYFPLLKYRIIILTLHFLKTVQSEKFLRLFSFPVPEQRYGLNQSLPYQWEIGKNVHFILETANPVKGQTLQNFQDCQDRNHAAVNPANPVTIKFSQKEFLQRHPFPKSMPRELFQNNRL